MNTGCVLSVLRSPNLSVFISLQTMRNHSEWQDECDDTACADVHVPEIETDILLHTELSRQQHCSPLSIQSSSKP